METITSRQNSRFKEIRKLTGDKKYREETECFFVDGVNFVAQAIENDWEIVTLVYVPNKIDSDFKKQVISRVSEAKYLPLDESLYETLATKKDIQGVGAVIRQKLIQNKLFPGVGVVLENIANPGNLGSIARLCAAFDIRNLYVIRPAVEFFHPEVVRSSMGAIFCLNLIAFDSTGAMKRALDEKPFFCLGTSLQEDSIRLSDLALATSQVARLVWFGGEARGLSDEAKDLCETLVKVPISSLVDSLNVAESAAIVLYELFVKK